ncbi:uncharacterized protein LOC115448251 [Manduca sexta]|uniref:uncharacterized protein LOC115448251 n=1 Tax=Manduca sexta TaxID=7130 RepID=UPI0018906F62|nr:uncharacterized protein LOC115448251 [Manduca sexta]
MKAGRIRTFCNNCEEEDSDDEQEDGGQDFKRILKDIQGKVSTLPGLRKQLNHIMESMSLLSDKYDTLLAEHEESKKKIIHLEKSFITISNKNVYLEKCNIVLEQRLDKFDQTSRKHNLEIVGIEQLPNENIQALIKTLGDMLEVNTTDIEWVSRLPQRKSCDKPAPIKVGFTVNGTNARDAWLSQRRKLAEISSCDVTGGSQKYKIYLNEDLTKPTRELLWKTKKQLRGTYKYIWVHNGKILVKKGDGDKSILIQSEGDICDLLNK